MMFLLSLYPSLPPAASTDFVVLQYPITAGRFTSCTHRGRRGCQILRRPSRGPGSTACSGSRGTWGGHNYISSICLLPRGWAVQGPRGIYSRFVQQTGVMSYSLAFLSGLFTTLASQSSAPSYPPDQIYHLTCSLAGA